jgi:hypothetical protein
MQRRENNLDLNWLKGELGGDGPASEQSIERSLLTALWPFYHQQFDDPSPSGEEMQAALSEISQAARSLKERLQSLDPRSRRWLAGGYEELSKSDQPNFSEQEISDSAFQFSENGANMARNVEVLEAAISTLSFPIAKRSRGQKPKTAVKELIFSVSEILREHSGQDPLEGFHRDAINERYEGRLVRIMEHIFDNFAPDLNLTNAAIGEQIRRTIGDRS